MKLHNLLLTAALLLTASVAFAKKDDKVVAHDPVAWDSFTEARHMTMNVTVFPMNGGWTYYVAGYDADNNIIEGTKIQLDPNNENVLVKKYSTKAEVNALELPDTLTASEQAEIKSKSQPHGVYEFSVDFKDEAIDHFGIIATHPHEISSVINVTKNKGADFFTLVHNDDTIAYYGKGQLEYNNGAVILVGVNKTFGAPLPAPIVTLLIALGFGAALVMFRSRKQKA